jgi:uroporphyrin-III C-methyltransferase / precorrin-2 dehydrogenase / sirohydrochlorin ferrochelatase
MNQLPLFVSLRGKPVILLGEGEAAAAKRRLIERAGGNCRDETDHEARLAFVAIEDDAEAEATTTRLKARGLLVNVVDRPALCDFTVPAIVDRDPLLVAVGTGGASAGLAKMVRQAIERLLPERLGALALALQAERGQMRAKWPDGAQRRRQIDAALSPGGVLDPLDGASADRVEGWLDGDADVMASQVQLIELASNDPEEMTLKQAGLLARADHIYLDGDISPRIANRARADAVRHQGMPTDAAAEGLVIHLRLRHEAAHG